MSKMSIEWHEECLKNQRATLARKREELVRLEGDYRRLESDIHFLDDQIQSAKVTKKDGFDADRYKRKVSARR